MRFHKRLQLHEAAAAESTRYAVSGILIEKTATGARAVATDGRILAIVGLPDVEEDLRVSPGIIVERAAWQAACAGARNPGKRDPAEKTASLFKSPDGKGVSALHRDGNVRSFGLVDARFPDVDSVIPRGDVVMRIGLNPRLLHQLAQAIGALNVSATDKQIEMIELVIRKDSLSAAEKGKPRTVDGPIEVRCAVTSALGFIMPISVEK